MMHSFSISYIGDLLLAVLGLVLNHSSIDQLTETEDRVAGTCERLETEKEVAIKDSGAVIVQRS